MTATTALITADSFPTPHLALRTDDPDEIARIATFADRQAETAETLRLRLAPEWSGSDQLRRLTLLRGLHAEATAWRRGLALQTPRRLGEGLPLDVARFTTTLRDGGPNYDRIGDIGRLKVKPEWDAATRTYQNGRWTHAYQVMADYGAAAKSRFDREASTEDVLENVVRMNSAGRTITGNRIVRRGAARGIADALLARTAARGRDTSRLEDGGELMYVVTADPDDADTMFNIALTLLAGAGELAPLARLTAWQQARYLLYQAPRYKKGSDAVTRVFLVAVGALLFGRPPILQQDVDLQCMVLGQPASTEMDGDTALVRP
jgi:hypothetical protein